MFDLFRAEFLRFRRWSLAFVLIHLALLGFYGRVVDPLQQPLFVYQIVGLLYWLSGVLLGLYQMGSYRRPNTWLNLLHRPLATRRIASALLGGGTAHLLLAILLPVLLMVLVQDGLSQRVVDLRHYQLPLAALGIAVLGYFSGAYALLAPARYAPMVFVFTVLLLGSEASGPAILVVLAVLIGAVLFLLHDAFKPDLSATPKRPGALLLTLVATAFGVNFVVGTIGSIGYQTAWIVVGDHPLNGGARAGSFVHASRSEPRDLVAAGLAASDDPEAPLWRVQAELSDPLRIEPMLAERIDAGAMTNPAPLEFDDEERAIRYAFSHDIGRFVGRSLRDDRATAALGVGADQAPFPAIPLPVEDVLIAANRLYRYDAERGQIDLRLELPAGEHVVATPQRQGDFLYVLSDQALYQFDAEAYRRSVALLPARHRLALPMPAAEVQRIDVMDVLDGQVVSLLRGRDAVDEPGITEQSLIRVQGSSTRVLATRALSPDFPLALRYFVPVLSPTLFLAYREWKHLLAPTPLLGRRVPVAIPLAVALVALGLQAFSGLFAWIWLGRTGFSGGWRFGLATLVAALGLPGAIALRLFAPQARVPRGEPARHINASSALARL